MPNTTPPPYTTTKLHRVATPDQAALLIGDTVPQRQPNTPRNTLIIDADTNQPVAAYLDMPGLGHLRNKLQTIHYGSVERAKNYTSKSQIFGYSPRQPMRQRESCSAASLNHRNPELMPLLDDLADRCTNYMQHALPNIITQDQNHLKEITPDWKIGKHKQWTSGVINHTAQLPYHRDNFNYETWSAMPVLRRGTRGGHLHLPEYDLVIPCQDSTVTFFLGKNLVHGVTPIQQKQPDGYRFSIVYYALRGMKDCYTHAKETAYGRQKRTERQRDIARRLAEGITDVPQ